VEFAPADDAGFIHIDGKLIPRPDGPAAGRIDLVTVLDHEIGPLLDLAHSDAENGDYLMANRLVPDLRRRPTAAEIDLLLRAIANE
jgi:hypothetical protein